MPAIPYSYTKEFFAQSLPMEESEDAAHLKEELRYDRISKDYYERARLALHLQKIDQIGASQFSGYALPADRLGEHTLKLHWWQKRELARMVLGVYEEPTSIVKKISKAFPHFFAHMSIKTPGHMAYTASFADGLRDAQVPISVGRFLTRFATWLSDHEIADLEAQHRSELTTDDVQFACGEEIAKIYQLAAKGGVTSCMTKQMSSDPILSYNTPGVQIAYLLNKDGSLKARCMVVEVNGQKRRIRTYGDRTLASKLARLGYAPGGWAGVEFPVRPVPSYDNGDLQAFAMPYLDCNEGPASSDGSYVTHLDGKIIGLDAVTRTRYTNVLGGQSVSTPSAEGFIRLRPVSSAEFTFTCPISGKTYNMLVGPVGKVKYLPLSSIEDGSFTLVDIASETVEDRERNLVERYYISGPGASRKTAYVDSSVPTFETVTGRIYIESEWARRAENYYRLDPTFYPDDCEWKHGFIGLQYLDINLAGWDDEEERHVLIRPEDAINVISARPDGGGRMRLQHKSTLDKAWIKVHTIDKRLTYCEDPALIGHTVSGRKVVKGVHSVATTWDGKVDFLRNLHNLCFVGSKIYYSSKDGKPDWTNRAFLEAVLKLVGEENAFTNALRDTYIHLTANDGTQIDNYAPFRNCSPMQFVTDYPLSKLKTEKAAVLAAMGSRSREIILYLWSKWEMQAAEANALDYSIGQKPYAPEVITGLSPQQTVLANKLYDRYFRVGHVDELLTDLRVGRSNYYNLKWYSERYSARILSYYTESQFGRAIQPVRYWALNQLRVMLMQAAEACGYPVEAADLSEIDLLITQNPVTPTVVQDDRFALAA